MRWTDAPEIAAVWKKKSEGEKNEKTNIDCPVQGTWIIFGKQENMNRFVPQGRNAVVST